MSLDSRSGVPKGGSGVRRRAHPITLLAVTPALRALVIADSVPAGARRRDACNHCGTPLGLTGPVRSLTPAGRCAGCRARVGAPPGAVELLLAVALLAVLLAGRPIIESVAFVWWVLCAVPLVFVDLAAHRLPDRMTWPAAAGVAGLLGLAALLDGAGDALLRAALAGVGVALAFAASAFLLGRRGFGLGDAKLGLSAAFILGWLGWPQVLAGLLVAFAGSAVAGLALLVAGRVRWSSSLPFGPFLVLGTLAGLVLSGLAPSAG